MEITLWVGAGVVALTVVLFAIYRGVRVMIEWWIAESEHELHHNHS